MSKIVLKIDEIFDCKTSGYKISSNNMNPARNIVNLGHIIQLVGSATVFDPINRSDDERLFKLFDSGTPTSETLIATEVRSFIQHPS